MADDLPPGYTVDKSGDDLPPGYTAVSAPTGTQTGSIVRGIPVLGPLLDKGVAAIAAAPAAVLPGEGYKAMYNKMIGGQDRYEKEHPVASTIGQTAGSVISTVPVARALPALFGGATMPGQMAAGSVLGGADAAVRSGGDVDAIKTGALIGGASPVLGSILAPIGQGIAAGTRAIADRTPGVRNVIARKVAPPPNQEIFDAAENGYQTLSRGGVLYSRPHLDDLNTLIRQDLHSGSISTQRSGQQTRAILDDNFANLPPNPTSLHTTRKELQDVISTHGASSPEGRSALIAKNHIDNFLEAPPPNAIASGQFDARTVGARLREANANYRAAMTDRELREKVAKGLTTADNETVPFLAEGARTRQAVAGLRRDQNAAKFRLPNENEALRDISRSGSMGESILRGLSHVTGSGRFGTPLTTAGAAAIGLGSLFPPAVPLALGIGGSLAGSAATTGLTRRAVEKASNTIRANAPYSQAQMRQQVYQPQLPNAPYTPWKSSIGDRAHRNEIARLLALQAAREVTEP
jgi:hypothetical protein